MFAVTARANGLGIRLTVDLQSGRLARQGDTHLDPLRMRIRSFALTGLSGSDLCDPVREIERFGSLRAPNHDLYSAAERRRFGSYVTADSLVSAAKNVQAGFGSTKRVTNNKRTTYRLSFCYW